VAADPDELSEAFWAVSRRMREASVAAWAAYDVTPGQVRALRVVERHGHGGDAADGVRASELAQHLRIAPRSATEVVDGLEAKGLVERRPDPADRRALRVVLTERGRALSRQLRAAKGAESERVFGRLSAPDRTELARILRALSEPDAPGE
jgi:DNA-binding MarR family transcriptional regulator